MRLTFESGLYKKIYELGFIKWKNEFETLGNLWLLCKNFCFFSNKEQLEWIMHYKHKKTIILHLNNDRNNEIDSEEDFVLNWHLMEKLSRKSMHFTWSSFMLKFISWSLSGQIQLISFGRGIFWKEKRSEKVIENLESEED